MTCIIAVGTVTGIISGTGSMTAALGLCLIGPLQTAHGWAAVWFFLIACALAGIALIFPKVYKEIYQHDADFERASLEMKEECRLNESAFEAPPSSSCHPQHRKNYVSSSSYQGYRYGAISCSECK
jgi:hypothetical protein